MNECMQYEMVVVVLGVELKHYIVGFIHLQLNLEA